MLIEHKDQLLIAQGNQAKFRQLMEITSDELLHFAMGFLRNKELSEEIVSDVYVKIWYNRKDLIRIDNLKSYLFISVKNACLSNLRKTNGNKIVLVDEYQDFMFIEVSGPEDELIDKEALNQIHEAIGSLPPKCQLAFTLAKINGLKHKEIAEIMEISEKTVNNHLIAAVKKITEMLNIDRKTRKMPHPLNRASLYSIFF